MTVDVAALYESGMGIRGVAEEIGSSYSTVWRRLHAAGVQLRPAGGRPLEPDPLAEYLAARYRSGESLRDLEAATGYRYGFIRTRVLAAGVELRGPNGRPRKGVA